MSSPLQSTPPLAAYTPVNAGAVSKRNTVMLMISAAVIALVGGFGFFLINGQIQDQLKTQADLQTQVGSAQQIASRDATAHAAYTEIQSQLRYVNDPVDVKSYVPTLLPQIEALAKSNNLQVSSITPGLMSLPPSAAPAAPPAGPNTGGASTAPPAAPIAAPAYETMPLSINLTGSYRDIMKYVYSLTRFPKVVSLKGIGLHPIGSAPTAPGADKVNVSMTLVAYVFTSPALQTTNGSASIPTTAQTASNAPVPTATPAEPRPMHGAMLPPTVNNPLPTPASLKTLTAAKTSASSAPLSESHK